MTDFKAESPLAPKTNIAAAKMLIFWLVYQPTLWEAWGKFIVFFFGGGGQLPVDLQTRLGFLLNHHHGFEITFGSFCAFFCTGHAKEEKFVSQIWKPNWVPKVPSVCIWGIIRPSLELRFDLKLLLALTIWVWVLFKSSFFLKLPMLIQKSNLILDIKTVSLHLLLVGISSKNKLSL